MSNQQLKSQLQRLKLLSQQQAHTIQLLKGHCQPQSPLAWQTQYSQIDKLSTIMKIKQKTYKQQMKQKYKIIKDSTLKTRGETHLNENINKRIQNVLLEVDDILDCKSARNSMVSSTESIEAEGLEERFFNEKQCKLGKEHEKLREEIYQLQRKVNLLENPNPFF